MIRRLFDRSQRAAPCAMAAALLGLLAAAPPDFASAADEAPAVKQPAPPEEGKPSPERPRRSRRGEGKEESGAAGPDRPAPKLVLTIEGDVDAALAPTVGRFTTLFYESYPKLLARFDDPEKPASRNIRIAFDRNLKSPAHCVGDRITVGVDWITKHPDDVGLLTHELTHAVQHYPKSDPGWLTEGIADYARHLYGPAVQPGWKLPAKLSEKQSYTNSYNVTARFLVWLDEKHPGSVDKLHRRMQRREFEMDDFKTFTGSDVDALWKQCVAELSAAKPD